MGTTVKMWDVVMCKYPLEESPDKAGIKARPVLVLGSDQHSKLGAVLKVIYGTSQKLTPRKTGELVIDATNDAGDLAAAGLTKSTKFMLARRSVLPFSEEYFVNSSRTGTPVIGHFTKRLQKRAAEAFNELMKR